MVFIADCICSYMHKRINGCSATEQIHHFLSFSLSLSEKKSDVFNSYFWSERTTLIHIFCYGFHRIPQYWGYNTGFTLSCCINIHIHSKNEFKIIWKPNNLCKNPSYFCSISVFIKLWNGRNGKIRHWKD